MKKVTLEFWVKDQYDASEVETVMKANDLLLALFDVSNEYRSVFKHGSQDQSLQKLIDDSKEIKDEDGFESTVGYEIVEKLQKKFYAILEDYGIDLDKLVY